MAMKDHPESTWPPASGLTAINVPRKDAILITSASAGIEAPAKDVFEALLCVGDYPKWNSFCPKVTMQSQPHGVPALESEKLHVGTVFTFHVIMDSNKPKSETPTQLMVTDISTPDSPSTYISPEKLKAESSFTANLQSVYRVSWKCEGGFVSKGLKTERFHEVIITGDKECEVRTWECQGGILARTVRWMYEKTLMEKFKLWCDDLKKYCEAKTNAVSDVRT